MDKRTGERSSGGIQVDLAVDEADLATAVDAGETDTHDCHAGNSKKAAAGKLERAVVGWLHDDVAKYLRVRETRARVPLHIHRHAAAVAAVRATDNLPLPPP